MTKCARCEELEAKIRWLQGDDQDGALPDWAVLQFKLKCTPLEAKLLLALTRRERIAYVNFIPVLWGSEENAPEDYSGILGTTLCTLRRKLRKHGVEIATLWGWGLQMSQKDRAWVSAVLNPAEIKKAS